MTSPVFISYSQKDRGAYSLLCKVLDGKEINRFDTANLQAGNPLTQELHAAIEQCDLCVFLATKQSIESKWCLAELGAFWGAGKKVLIYLCDQSIQETDLPPQFKGNLWTWQCRATHEGNKHA